MVVPPHLLTVVGEEEPASRRKNVIVHLTKYVTSLLVCDLKQDVTSCGQLTTLPMSVANEQVLPTPSQALHCLPNTK